METTSMCRICLAVDVRMYSLVNTHLQEVYEQLSGAPLETQDERPTQACYICFSRLKNSYTPRLSCVRSEELLTEMMNANMITVQESCGTHGLQTVHPVVQLSVGGVPQAAVSDLKLKIECRDADDDASAEQDGAELDYSALGLNLDFDISVDVVKEEPEAVGGSDTYALVSETCQQTMQKSNEVIFNNVNKTEVKYNSREQKSGTRILKDKSGQRIVGLRKNARDKSINQSTIKLQKYKENIDILDHSEDQSAKIKPKQYTCDVCLKSFARKSGLKIHICSHTGARPHQCSVCKKCFVQNNDLIKHMRVHTGEKPYECNVCKKCFGQKNSLNLHIRTHTGEKPYSLFNKQFPDYGTYRGHIVKHGDKKLYQCGVCEKTYSRQYHLNRHIVTHAAYQSN